MTEPWEQKLGQAELPRSLLDDYYRFLFSLFLYFGFNYLVNRVTEKTMDCIWRVMQTSSFCYIFLLLKLSNSIHLLSEGPKRKVMWTSIKLCSFYFAFSFFPSWMFLMSLFCPWSFSYRHYWIAHYDINCSHPREILLILIVNPLYFLVVLKVFDGQMRNEYAYFGVVQYFVQ